MVLRKKVRNRWTNLHLDDAWGDLVFHGHLQHVNVASVGQL